MQPFVPEPPDIDVRHRRVVEAAWDDFDGSSAIDGVEELSALVSTNRVYRLHLADGTTTIAKSSNYGSFFLFAEDHNQLHRLADLLWGGRFDHFMARSRLKDGQPYIWYDGEMWAVFYEELELRRRLPRVLTDAQIEQLGREIAEFHKSCAAISPMLAPPSKTAKSDMVNLYESLDGRFATERFGLDQSRIDLVRRHTHRFLMAVHESGYDYWPKLPVLMDWNLGNFSVSYDGVAPGDEVAPGDSRFHLFSRWDYDWFRIESRLLDFYFLSRVSSETGDKSHFTYSVHTLFEHRFVCFLRAYHEVLPLTEDEIIFLGEAYRFFLLNYVVREGRHFFRHEFWQQLLHDAVDIHLPSLDSIDFAPLAEKVLE